MTVNYDYERKQHIRQMSTHAPGPPIPPRRKPMSLWLEWAIALVGVTEFVLVLLVTAAMLGMSSI